MNGNAEKKKQNQVRGNEFNIFFFFLNTKYPVKNYHQKEIVPEIINIFILFFFYFLIFIRSD